ncbi:MAG: hypothetical protein AAF572_11180 [Cyanobacteria bacterium P01_B01_bin.77]
MANAAAAVCVDTTTQLISLELSADRSFQPAPLGIPQRRLSGGTR